MTIAALVATGPISCAEDPPNNVVLDFTASWCGPCQQMSPIVHRLQKQGYDIRKVDVDQQKKLAQSYGITSIPTFVLVVDGKEISRVSGITSEDQLRRMALQAGQAARNQPTVSAQPIQEGIPLPKSPRSPNVETDFDGPPEPKVLLGDAAPVTPTEPEKPRRLFPKPKLPNLFPKRDKPAVAETRPEHAIFRGKPPEVEHAVLEYDPLRASVRIRVTDETGANFGSGTIIDSRVGRTTILTCGHLFKPQSAKSTPKTVEVDLFLPGGRHEMYVGKLVDFDLDSDVGVITINTAGRLAVSSIATTEEAPVVQTQLISIGCGGGEQPAKEAVQVTALNRYDGPDNIECTGLPQQGRSGGGLFDANGQLVGVCIAADQDGQRGLYAALKPIHALLTRSGFKHVLPPAAPVRPEAVEPVSLPGELLADHTDLPAAAAPNDSLLDKAFGKADMDWLDGRGVPNRGEIAALFDDAPDAEVICIVRPKNGESQRVVILNQASTKFVSYLLDSLDTPRAAPTTASLRVEDTTDLPARTSVSKEAVGVPKRAPGNAERQEAKLASQRSRFGSRRAE